MNEQIHAHMKRMGGYKYEITFDELPGAKIVSDESAPVGASEGVTARGGRALPHIEPPVLHGEV
jgi:hypothetical protein